MFIKKLQIIFSKNITIMHMFLTNKVYLAIKRLRIHICPGLVSNIKQPSTSLIQNRRRMTLYVPYLRHSVKKYKLLRCGAINETPATILAINQQRQNGHSVLLALFTILNIYNNQHSTIITTNLILKMQYLILCMTLRQCRYEEVHQWDRS